MRPRNPLSPTEIRKQMVSALIELAGKEKRDLTQKEFVDSTEFSSYTIKILADTTFNSLKEEAGLPVTRRKARDHRKSVPVTRKRKTVLCLKCDRMFSSKIDSYGRALRRICPPCTTLNENVAIFRSCDAAY